MKHSLSLSVLCLSVLSLSSCGRNPVSPDSRVPATIRVIAQIVKTGALAKTTAATQTTWDSLVVAVSGADFSPLRYSIRLGANAEVIDTTLPVPAGEKRRVEVQTVNSGGTPIHSAPAQTLASLAPGQKAEMWFRLQPLCGSIYISLSDIPTTVDSVFAVFRATSGQSWQTQAKRNTRLFLSIDNIPDNTTGTLSIFGVSATGDTLYRTQTQMTVRIDRMTTLNAGFSESDASIGLTTEIIEPGVTLVAATMTRAIEPEAGPLVITEIMYAANDSEYVEIHNPTGSDLVYDTLVLEVDGVKRTLTDISIASGDFYVVGRTSLPWADAWFTTAAALDLSSITGNWITLRAKDQSVMDRVSFAAGVNDFEWPRISGKASIGLDSLTLDPTYNNYGRNWVASTSGIDTSVTQQLGTPGSR